MDPIRGRGAAENPPNRFQPRHVVPDPDDPEPEGPAPATQLIPDATKSIITRFDSPDLGSGAHVNPYRGCEHGCSYCLSGETPILMGDGRLRPLESIRPGDEIYGTRRQGWYRRYVKTRVMAHWRTVEPAYLIRLEDGTRLISGGNHRFLTERGWKFVTGIQRPHLTLNNKLMGTGAFALPGEAGRPYRLGYLCGVIRGDALLRSYSYLRPGRAHGDVHLFRLAMTDVEALERSTSYLEGFGIATYRFLFQKARPNYRALWAIRTNARKAVDGIRRLIEWPASPSVEWQRGYLAGLFDAEGSYSQGILRIANTDSAILRHAHGALKRLGFDAIIEDRHLPNRLRDIRIRGGLTEHLRFFHCVDTAITRKRSITGQAVKSSARLRVISIQPLGRRRLFDITTGSGDFIANGVVSHNCYARPYHEYLGYSAGLDFETKIVVKEKAPELLRGELAAPRWKPETISMSGVTDCYQPVERKLGITRGCLAVLAEFRNPVVIITKNHLVTRDIDLLRELAAHRAAAVVLSVTTLDASLQRVLEPRTSVPARRLAAIEALAAAGIPVGVNVAPVIPALTDHEIPSILAAAAKAGATFAGHSVVRLPHAVKELFEAWLQRHFPDRKEKVLNRIREVRGGKLNDPRFGTRMTGEGIYAQQIHDFFRIAARRGGLDGPGPELSTAAFRRPPGPQLELFP